MTVESEHTPATDATSSGLPAQPESRRGKHGPQPRASASITSHITMLARSYTVEAVEGLVAIARDAKNPAAARAMAWDKVLDRGWGKASQKVEIETDQSGPNPTVVAIQNVILASLESARTVREIASDAMDLLNGETRLLEQLPAPSFESSLNIPAEPVIDG